MAKTLMAWVMAARLRTLPLSVSGILVGAAVGVSRSQYSGLLESSVFWLAILTTLGLQILSNFANDYGDGIKGTDNESRIGPKRAIQSGLISHTAMRKGLLVTSIITFITALALIYKAFGQDAFGLSVLFLVLGVLAIVAAIKYTVGNSAYGYRGLGDVFVFLFFGLLSVVGSYVLFTKTISADIFLPAITIGCLSTAVLNLNNLRDIDGDKAANKNTLVVKLGWRRGKRYQYGLIGLSFLTLLVYFLINAEHLVNYIPFLAFIPIGLHVKKLSAITSPLLVDPELKKVALSTFLLAILFVLTHNL